MKRAFLTLISGLLLALFAPPTIAADWQLAEPGWEYSFPRDHLPHPAFKTEWWYFTGNLRDASGHTFGYQLTFFRQGIRPPGQRASTTSRFITDDLKFAHFTITDIPGSRFRFAQKLSRGAFGEAGFDSAEPKPARIAWIDDWQLTHPTAETFGLRAASEFGSLQLDLGQGKPWTIHGRQGISQKADGPGHASHYYSGTRLPTRGSVVFDGRNYTVEGETWFDHEWATNQLTPNQLGWDWFSLQFGDGSELMLYRLRLRDGTADPNSSGTFVAADGTTRHLNLADYTLRPLSTWKSPATGALYPISWEVAIPSLDLKVQVTGSVQNQELVLNPIAYWEGAVVSTGTRAGAAVKGHGYLELTGYAGALVGLSTETVTTQAP
jgi:predicted secreted hydrolase